MAEKKLTRRSALAGAVGAAIGATVLGKMAQPAYAEYQGHMQNALAALQGALGALQGADPDKGGHRERAIDLVTRAIGQVNDGIRFANHHDRDY